MRISDVFLRLTGARNPNCPNDADVLAYSESRLSARSRARFETHFAGCDDCRQVLAFLGRETDEAPAPVTGQVVSVQTDRVLAYIQRDERNRSKPAPGARAAAGFYVSYRWLASVGLPLCAIVIASVFLLFRGQSPADASMTALRLAVKDTRYTEARISGLDYSRYAGTTRDDNDNHDDLLFGNAENKVKAETCVDARLMLARVWLARGTPDGARRALEILNLLEAGGVESALALNDMGVARLQLEDYDAAIEYFGKALDKSPGYDDALFNKALAEEGARYYGDAKRDWQLFIDQSSDENWKAEARIHLKDLRAPSGH